jgi:hypothetical protein
MSGIINASETGKVVFDVQISVDPINIFRALEFLNDWPEGFTKKGSRGIGLTNEEETLLVEHAMQRKGRVLEALAQLKFSK